MLGCVPYPNLPGCSFSMPSNTLFFLSAFMILLSLTTQRKAYRISWVLLALYPSAGWPSSPSSAFASFRSLVSKPSVNQL